MCGFEQRWVSELGGGGVFMIRRHLFCCAEGLGNEVIFTGEAHWKQLHLPGCSSFVACGVSRSLVLLPKSLLTYKQGKAQCKIKMLAWIRFRLLNPARPFLTQLQRCVVGAKAWKQICVAASYTAINICVFLTDKYRSTLHVPLHAVPTLASAGNMCSMTPDLSCSSSFPFPDTSTWVQFSTLHFFTLGGIIYVFMYVSVVNGFVHVHWRHLRVSRLQVVATKECNLSGYFYDPS